jgi:hypothetical protein
MTEATPRPLSKGIQHTFDAMAMIYVAVAALFVVNPNWPILMVNKTFSHYNWPMVFFPTEKFWLSLAVSVPVTRAFLAFTASRRPAYARFCVNVLQVSLATAGILFGLHFLFHKHAPLYAVGFFVELLQVVFYSYLKGKLTLAPASL